MSASALVYEFHFSVPQQNFSLIPLGNKYVLESSELFAFGRGGVQAVFRER
jgi:hypothetical protein